MDIKNYTGMPVKSLILQWDKDLYIPEKASVIIKEFSSHPYATLRTRKRLQSFGRYVAEQKMGRPLKKNEEVHHINFKSLDNRWVNLFVCSKEEHIMIHEYIDGTRNIEQLPQRLAAITAWRGEMVCTPTPIRKEVVADDIP